MIAGIGVQGVMALLRSGRLRILCESVAIGQTAQSAMLRKAGAVLPTGYYSFVAIRGNNRDLYIHNCLQEFHKADAALKDIIKLKRQAVDAIEPWRENAGNQAVVQLRMDLRSNSPVVRAAMNLTPSRRVWHYGPTFSFGSSARRGRRTGFSCRLQSDSNWIRRDGGPQNDRTWPARPRGAESARRGNEGPRGHLGILGPRMSPVRGPSRVPALRVFVRVSGRGALSALLKLLACRSLFLL